MDSLRDLLYDYGPKEPPEILAIKKYIYENFNAEPQISQQEEALVITVSSSSLANTLRFHVSKLKSAAQTDKQIIFRIG